MYFVFCCHVHVLLTCHLLSCHIFVVLIKCSVWMLFCLSCFMLCDVMWCYVMLHCSACCGLIGMRVIQHHKISKFMSCSRMNIMLSPQKKPHVLINSPLPLLGSRYCIQLFLLKAPLPMVYLLVPSRVYSRFFIPDVRC